MSETRAARKRMTLPRFGGGDADAARFAAPLAPLGALAALGSAGSAGSAGLIAPAALRTASRGNSRIVPAAGVLAPPAARASDGAADKELASLQTDRPRSIAISIRLMSLVGDTATGVFLSQLVFWSRHGTEIVERDGWVFKTAQDWERETGLGWKTQRRARDILARLDLIEERRLSMPARLEFRLRMPTIVAALGQGLAMAVDGAASVDWRAWQAAPPDGMPGMAEALLGRSFLFHAALSAPLTLTGAMMCSRLLAGVRWSHGGPALPAGFRDPMFTRFVSMPRTKWQQETGLSRDQWQTARRRLREAGILAERFGNYPRRVDLAVNLGALAQVLRSTPRQTPVSRAPQSTAAVEARYRARQASAPPASPDPAFMDRPNQPTESPDSAFSDRSILPTAIDPSRLYLTQSQVTTPQPPPPRAGAPETEASGGGGGGIAGHRETPFGASEHTDQARRDDASQPKATTPTPTAVALGELYWPASFTAGDREQAARHLVGLPRDAQQAVLDEVQWAHQSGSVRSPVGLTRSLAGKARAGAFAPDGAHRVAEARAAREQHARCEANASPAPAPTAPEAKERTPEEEARYQANRERLRQITATLRRRVG